MKVHLLLKKEEINPYKMKDKTAVVFDILLATSTITAALEFGAKEIIPVMNGGEAVREALNRNEEDYVLVGEHNGVTIEGFLPPNPLALKGNVAGKTVILSTTNGTVAIKNLTQANTVYVASLLNSKAVVEHLLDNCKDGTIVLVCSGSSGEFNVEDFFGAGYFIDCLTARLKGSLELTDSAFAAKTFYRGKRNNALEILKASRVGEMLLRYQHEKEIEFVSTNDLYQIIPMLINDKTIVGQEKTTNLESLRRS